jgi:hypothetical protein
MFQTPRSSWSSIYTITCYYSLIQVVQHVDEAEKYGQPAVTLITFPLVSEDDGFYINFRNIGQNFMGFLLEPYHKHSLTFIELDTREKTLILQNWLFHSFRLKNHLQNCKTRSPKYSRNWQSNILHAQSGAQQTEIWSSSRQATTTKW